MLLTDLIAYWKMDGNSSDSLGVNNGTDTSISYVSGKLGQSAQFNGTSSIITTSLLSAEPSTAASMFGWVYLDSLTSCRLFGWSDTGSASNAFTPAFNLLGNNKIFWVIRNSTAGSADIQGTIALSTNTWYHIGCVGDNMNGYTSYVNGVQDGTNPAPINLGKNNFFIGASSNSQSFTPGRIDELGLWGRRLSLAEIAELYNSGAGLSYPFTKNSNPAFFLNLL